MKVQTSFKSGGLRMNQNAKQVRQAVRSMKVRTNVKAGGATVPNLSLKGSTRMGWYNHNETLARPAAALKVRTNVKAGGRFRNHNQRLARTTGLGTRNR